MRIHLREINSSLEPHEIHEIFRKEKNTIFLDSSRDEKTLGRYSFIGINEFLNFKWEKTGCFLNGKRLSSGDGFLVLRDIMKKYSIENNTEIPFIGGAMGYFSYDLGNKIEYIDEKVEEKVDIPLAYFNFYKNIIIYDNLEKKSYISALELDDNWEEELEEILHKIEGYTKNPRIHKDKYVFREEDIDYSLFTSNFTKENYIESIEKLIDYIRNGDVYIANLTQQYSFPTEKDSYDVFSILRSINPAPFGAYLNLDGFSIISSSPERFIRVKDNSIETRPIKGTRPRGICEEENLLNKKALENSEKDKSELLMIVDLERNDLSRVCKPHSVKVTELFKIEEYATVYHLVSTIIGELKENKDVLHCIEATFPGGSITGAPKIRSREIISELEKINRNIYTGAIGYLGFCGNSDFNIVIRTVLMKDKIANFGVGGGITFESNSIDEYEETIQKAKALMFALS